MKAQLLLAPLVILGAACSSESANQNATGGSTMNGAGIGGVSSGGATSGVGGAGASAGGSVSMSGASTLGGSSAGAAPSAGASAGGSAGSGGTSAGGAGAGSGGSASGGAAGAGGAAGCGKASNSLFCEDFESYATGPAAAANGWKPVTNNGTLTIDSTHAQGKNALHVQTQGNGKAYIQLSPFAPPSNTFFGRVRLWVTAFPSAPDYAHYTLVEASGTEPGVVRPVGGQFISGKGALWGVGSDSGPTGDWTNWKESAPTEAGKWVCVEWSMASANNQIQVWIDGTAKPDLTVDTKTHGGSSVDFVFPKFNSIWFGWWLYQTGSTPAQFDLWLDDIALGAQRLGC